jgi:V/A-type H+-transporting ATPase subunit D
MMNVNIPHFEFKASDQTQKLPYGFAFTSGELDRSVLDVIELLPLMLELAEAEKTCNLLADEIEKTRRRVNALEHVVIPETKRNIKYITMRLEENERAATTRLMKVKDMMLNEN